MLRTEITDLPEATDAHVRTANTGNLAAGLLAAAVTGACAWPMAVAFRAPELKGLFLALAALPVMSAFVASPTAALKREMRFKPFALRFGWSGAAFRDLRTCAANVFTARAIMWFTGQAPRVIVGATLGPVALGLFTLANRIVDALVQVVLVPATQVARVEMRRFAEGREGLDEAIAHLLRGMALMAFPVGVGLTAVAPTLFHLWLGARWEGADSATQLIALTLLLQPVYYATSATLLALRRSHLDTVIQALLGASAVAATLAGARFGLDAVCGALLLRLALLAVGPLLMLSRAGGVSPWAAVRAPLGPLVAAVAMGAAVRFAQGPVDAAAGRLASLPVLVALGAAIYLPLAAAFAPEEARRVLAACSAVLRRLRPAGLTTPTVTL